MLIPEAVPERERSDLERIAATTRSQRLPFLVTLRSFIEHSRRGIWFLARAGEEKLKKAEHLTF
jgi:hypothetical protein